MITYRGVIIDSGGRYGRGVTGMGTCYWHRMAIADLDAICQLSEDIRLELKAVADDLIFPPDQQDPRGPFHGWVNYLQDELAWRRGVLPANADSSTSDACHYYLLYRPPTDKERNLGRDKGYTFDHCVVRVLSGYRMAMHLPLDLPLDF